MNGLLLEVDVAEIEVDGLTAAEARRVDELEERAVANRQRLVAGDLVEDGVDLLGLRRIGQPPRASRPELAVRNASRPEREAQQRPHGGELAGDRRPARASSGSDRAVRRRAPPM